MVFIAAARLIYCSPRHYHISPLLRRLHWLRIEWRINYKVCLTVFKELHGQAPEYITELCTLDRTQRRPLRSASTSLSRLLVPQRAHKSAFSDRAFAVAGPLQWNHLDVDLRVLNSTEGFKTRLKTFFFESSNTGALEMVLDH